MDNLQAKNLITNSSTKDKIIIDKHECIKVRAGLFKVVDKYVTSRSEFEQNESNQEIRLLVCAEPYTDTIEVKYVVTKKCYYEALKDTMKQENLMIVYNDYWKSDHKYEYKIDLSKGLIIINGKQFECIDEHNNGIYACVEYFGEPTANGKYPMCHPVLPRHWSTGKEFSGLAAIIAIREENSRFRDEERSYSPSIWYLCKSDNQYIERFVNELNNDKPCINARFGVRYASKL